MAPVKMFSTTHLFLILHFFLGAASVWNMKGSSGGAQDRSVLQSLLDPFSDDLDQDMLAKHMFKLYEKYNRENRLREGNTVRSFRAILGVFTHDKQNLILKKNANIVVFACHYSNNNLIQRRK